MIQQELEIINKLGLHARASAKFTQLAAKYKSESGSPATAAASTPSRSWA
jgi:phosphotransferase system HPr (HPr) family protein